MLWRLDQQALNTKLKADPLTTHDTEATFKLETMQRVTSAQLLDFGSPTGLPLEANEILPYMSVIAHSPADNNYSIILATGDLLNGGEARMLQTFVLDPGSANTTVTVTNDSVTLSYSANLESPQPTPVPRGIAALGIDWGRLRTTPLGAEFLPALVRVGGQLGSVFSLSA